MNILVLGGTGTAGSAIVKRLSDTTDDSITVFARNAVRKAYQSPKIKAVNGDATSVPDLRAALQEKDVVYCAISGYDLPRIAENLVNLMPECGVKRLIFMGAVGIYNEIPSSIGGAQYNVDNEPPQVPNRKAVDIIEASDLNYTIMRPGFLRNGKENDYVLTVKGEAAKGYVTTIPSVVKLAVQLIMDENLYARESVCITQDMTK